MNISRLIGFAPIYHVILCTASLLVPRLERKEWLTEWTSELWYLLQTCRREARYSTYATTNVARFCLGAFKDAVWLRRNSPSQDGRQILWLRSSVQCIVFLTVLALSSLFVFWRISVASDGNGFRDPPLLRVAPMLAHLLMIPIALLILPATTSLDLGEYPGMAPWPSRATRLRRWIFLAMKLALILPIVFCGTFDLAPIISRTGLQAHATLLGYVLAFRWALVDQRRRCPVCLRLLANPARIGQPSRTLLDWCGTELICTKGHGLLHVPEIPTSSYSRQRWLYLDPSWRSLFS